MKPLIGPDLNLFDDARWGNFVDERVAMRAVRLGKKKKVPTAKKKLKMTSARFSKQMGVDKNTLVGVLYNYITKNSKERI